MACVGHVPLVDGGVLKIYLVRVSITSLRTIIHFTSCAMLVVYSLIAESSFDWMLLSWLTTNSS